MRIKRTPLPALLLIGLVLAVTAQAQELPHQYKMVPAKPGEICTVCGTKLTSDDVALIVKGRRVPLSEYMVDEFMDHQEKYFASLQPKGALFQEDMDAPEGTATGGVSYSWFIVGLYILVALIFAGLSGYAAITKGLKPIPYFFIGFFFSVLGYFYVMSRPRKSHEGEIPAGLVKVPVTRTPIPCPSCRSLNHPSSQRCSNCGARLEPIVQSEVSRVLS